MTVKDLETIYDYGYWANRKLFEVIGQLTSEEFTREMGGEGKSIRSALVHILSAEWGWLARCGGPERGERLNPEDFPSLDSIKELWSEVESHVRAFLSSLKDEDLERTVEYWVEAGKGGALPLGALMRHAANHGVHHRGQITQMLRLMGRSSGNIDLLFYEGETRGVNVL
ncbi:MAG: DinB family protein [Acidobacteriota bacterium]